MRRQHAEIAGGGITGLTVACVLARRGWSVRVHERAPELREIGAGLFLKENGVAALRALGVFQVLEPRMVRLREGKVFDERLRVLLHRVTEQEQNYTVLRGELHRALADAAAAAGAEVVTGSGAAGADPAGALILEDGRRLAADLVIGADGYRSRVRDAVGLTKRLKTLPEGATRLLIRRTEAEAHPMQQEHWSRRHRMGFTPCSPEHVYIFLMAPADDAAGTAVPVDRDFWARRFPHLEPMIRRITDDAGSHAPLALVDVHGWRAGRVAILGDAAHAQPPNLGQGAGMSIANAHALGRHLDAAPDVESALAAWEAERRPVSEAVKRWSYWYGKITGDWPEAALSLRSALVWTLGHTPATARRWGWLWRGGIERGAGIT